MTDNKNGGLGSATRRPNQGYRDGINNNPSILNNFSLCPVCGGDHNVLVIHLENGGHIITRPFPKEKSTKVKVTNAKRRATRLDLVDVFWRPDEDRV